MLLRSIRFASIAFVLATAACSGSQSVGEPTQAASQATTVAPISVATHGRNKAIADAIGQVALRADQRATIEQMATDAETRMAPAVKAREALVLAIADQVQAGTLDRTALQPKIDALVAAHEAARPLDRAAFEKLHDLLTPDQRLAFVTAMQASFQSHQGQGGQPGQARGGRLHKWAVELGLTQDQQDQIKQKIQAQFQAHFAGAVTGTDEQKTDAVQDGQMVMRGHEMHQHMQQMLEAFKQDKFSMDAVSPIANEKPFAKEFSGHMLNMVETSLPVLTADQRTTLATKLRARAANLEADDEK
jgi:Spy/CpxP family protein refolding chaperone